MTRTVDKPWGHEEIWAETERYVGKILYITAGHRLSLQHHEIKDETIRILSGTMKLELEDQDGNIQDLILKEGMAAHIAPHRRHRMEAITDVSVLEVSTPELDDVVRHQDDYGRTGG
jgi:mannose-6-phosphate isomerase-like protein (cupin superfamily)